MTLCGPLLTGRCLLCYSLRVLNRSMPLMTLPLLLCFKLAPAASLSIASKILLSVSMLHVSGL